MSIARDWNYVVDTLLIELHLRPAIGAAPLLHSKDFNNIIFGMKAANIFNTRSASSGINGILVLIGLLVIF